MVQQFPYAEEMKNVMEQQEVATSSFLMTMQSFIDKVGFSDWEEDCCNSRFLIKQCIRRFSFKSSLPKFGCLSRTYTFSPYWATTPNSICTIHILDTMNIKLSENSHSSVCNLLYIQGQKNTRAIGSAAINTSTNIQANPHNRRGICWTNITQIVTTISQN